MNSHRSMINSGSAGSGLMDLMEGTTTASTTSQSGGGASSSSRGNSTRRQTTALSGITSTVDVKNADFLCPICFELISEAHITKCGHTFCYQCIMRSIETSKRCPKCLANISGQEMIFPNFLLNELVAKERLRQRTTEQLMNSEVTISKDVHKLKDLIARDSSNLTLPDVDVMLEILQHRRQLLETETSIAQNRLLLDFLRLLLRQKEDQRSLIDREIGLIRRDLTEVEFILRDIEAEQRMKKRTLRKAFSEGGGGGGGESVTEGGAGDDEQMVVDGSGGGGGGRRAREEEEEEEENGDEEEVEDDAIGGDENDDVDVDGGRGSDTNIDTTTSSVMHRRKIRRKHSTKQKVPELITTPQGGGGGGVSLPGAEMEGDSYTGFNTNDLKSDLLSGESFAVRKRRMYSHFEDFVNCYFNSRSQDLYFGRKGEGEREKGEKHSIAPPPSQQTPTISEPIEGGDAVGTVPVQQTEGDPLNLNPQGGGERGGGILEPEKPPRRMSSNSRIGLDEFRDSLVKFSRYSTCKTLATLGYSTDLSNGSIVSSIEFDKDNEFFAIAGVTKRIKIYDYLAVIRDVVDIHYPVAEMVSTSKISCVAWNSYHKNVLASSDYDGAVTIWDAITGQKTRLFQEHDKRCWSVDFNNVDSRLVASGSDDGRMKLWSLLSNNAVATLETKANICCVKFNPKSSCHIAFGSADHCVHYYDLRSTKKPLCVFTGHQKAVSYVKFLNESEIVSASTDSHLRLWNVNSPPYSKRSYVGHMNEKNFVGLATDGEYITCGSEDISLYVYYKGLSKPLFNLKIDRMNNGGGNMSIVNDTSSSDLNEFVSAVCWRKNCNVMVAANSRGIVKVLELV